MNVFEFAMQMEQDGRAFYLEHAEKVAHPALRQILLQLADDELKHYNIFKAMKEGTSAGYDDAKKTTILSTVKNVFETLKAENADFAFPPDAQAIWEEASEVERKAEQFYRLKAEEVEDDNQRYVLGRIADEEHRHWVTMQNVIRFLDRPQHWLEDAEWSNLEDY
jgi:rubrerythrin